MHVTAENSSNVTNEGERKDGQRPPPVERYHSGWDRWIVSNLVSGVNREKLRRRMISHGFENDFVDNRLEEIANSPILSVARTWRARALKMACMLDTIGKLSASHLSAVDEERDLAPHSFYDRYVTTNRPVVLRGLASSSKAVRAWSPRYLVGIMGDIEIEVTSDREGDPHFEDNFVRHLQLRSFAAFVEEVESGPSNNFYLVGKNRLLKRPEAAPLMFDLELPVGYLTSNARLSDCSIWIGPTGTITPLHHDSCNILFVQVYGRKRVRLIAPAYLPRLYNDRTCFTDFDPEAPDFDRFPLAQDIPVASVDVHPGDALLLPVGWWHHVRALDTSISVSFTQFRLPRAAHVWKWRVEEH